MLGYEIAYNFIVVKCKHLQWAVRGLFIALLFYSYHLQTWSNKQ